MKVINQKLYLSSLLTEHLQSLIFRLFAGSKLPGVRMSIIFRLKLNIHGIHPSAEDCVQTCVFTLVTRVY